MYVAKHYIGREYVPGEVITEDLSPDVIERWLKAGAIEKVPGYEPAEQDNIDGGDQKTDAEGCETESEAGTVTPAGGEAIADTLIDGENEDAAEIDEEAEPPEIDAADGIITAPARKTESKRGGRTGGGKGK